MSFHKHIKIFLFGIILVNPVIFTFAENDTNNDVVLANSDYSNGTVSQSTSALKPSSDSLLVQDSSTPEVQDESKKLSVSDALIKAINAHPSATAVLLYLVVTHRVHPLEWWFVSAVLQGFIKDFTDGLLPKNEDECVDNNQPTKLPA